MFKFFLIEPHIFFKASSSNVEGVEYDLHLLIILINVRREMKTQHLIAFALIMALNIGYSGAEPCTGTIANNLDIHIPAAIYQPDSGDKLNLWANLIFSGTDADGNLIWKLGDYGNSPTNLSATAGEVFRDTLQDGSLGPEMVWIPAGTFRMGDIQGGGGDEEQPVHEVSVDGFAMGRYEVIFAEYDKFAEATGREKPFDEGWGRGNLPVINVSWHDATAYAEWLSGQTGHGYRLPTEAEWEYAARAGTETKYWWGNEIDSSKANYFDFVMEISTFDSPAPVGSFDANPFGLYDTAGNLWEWTCSSGNIVVRPYNGQELQCVNSALRFILRGGSWGQGASLLRSAARVNGDPSGRGGHIGFRLARTQ